MGLSSDSVSHSPSHSSSYSRAARPPRSERPPARTGLEPPESRTGGGGADPAQRGGLAALAGERGDGGEERLALGLTLQLPFHLRLPLPFVGAGRARHLGYHRGPPLARAQSTRAAPQPRTIRRGDPAPLRWAV